MSNVNFSGVMLRETLSKGQSYFACVLRERAIIMLSNSCDGAIKRDGAGFSKITRNGGESLAAFIRRSHQPEGYRLTVAQNLRMANWICATHYSQILANLDTLTADIAAGASAPALVPDEIVIGYTLSVEEILAAAQTDDRPVIRPTESELNIAEYLGTERDIATAAAVAAAAVDAGKYSMQDAVDALRAAQAAQAAEPMPEPTQEELDDMARSAYESDKRAEEANERYFETRNDSEPYMTYQDQLERDMMPR